MELLKSAMRLAVCASLQMPGLLLAQTAPENVPIAAAAPSTPLPHFWEQKTIYMPAAIPSVHARVCRFYLP